MKINTQEWREYLLDELFDVTGTKTTKLSDLELHGAGKYPYVTTQSTNNGVAGFYNYFTEAGNVLTIDSAVTGFCSYQKNNFSASDHVEKLVPKFKLNQYHAYFLVTILNKERYKYSYGRKANQKKIKATRINLPINKEGEVDFKWIEKFIKQFNVKSILTNVTIAKTDLNLQKWKEFLLSDIFLLKKGKRLTKADMIKGNTNFLGAISENNGVREKIETTYSWEANCITVNYNGSVGEAFYQNEPFWASDDVNILYSNGWILNKYIAMFLITVIKQDRYRFSYGRKWTLEKMKNTVIKLPIKSNGYPDFDFMEAYIKKLPYSDRI